MPLPTKRVSIFEYIFDLELVVDSAFGNQSFFFSQNFLHPLQGLRRQAAVELRLGLKEMMVMVIEMVVWFMVMILVVLMMMIMVMMMMMMRG